MQYFGTSGALGFDTLAAQAVLTLKRLYPYIKLILVLPCKTQTQNWKKEDIVIYQQILNLADKVIYTSEEYHDDCMFKRNRHLVDHSGYCICYHKKSRGGTAYTVKYAQQKGLRILNLAQ